MPLAMAHSIVPNINRLAEAVRATGGAVVWIQTAYTDETLTSWSTLYGMVGVKGAEKRRRSLSRDSKGYDIFPDSQSRAAGPHRREVCATAHSSRARLVSRRCCASAVSTRS